MGTNEAKSRDGGRGRVRGIPLRLPLNKSMDLSPCALSLEEMWGTCTRLGGEADSEGKEGVEQEVRGLSAHGEDVTCSGEGGRFESLKRMSDGPDERKKAPLGVHKDPAEAETQMVTVCTSGDFPLPAVPGGIGMSLGG